MNLTQRVLDLLFPCRCAACDAIMDAEHTGFCAICEVSLTPLHNAIADEVLSGLRVLAPDAYGAALADALVRMKHMGRPETAGVLARRITARWPTTPRRGAVLVPVPLHVLDLRARGYNQAALLAAHLARAWGTPISDVLRRARRSGSQRGRDPSERRGTVAGAFTLRRGAIKRLADRPVILVDDVVTTGATALETARVLRDGGAEVAAVVAAARTL